MTLIYAYRGRGLTHDIAILDADGNTITPGVNDLVRVLIGRAGEVHKFSVTSGTQTDNGSSITKGASNRLRIDASDLGFAVGVYTLYVDYYDNADAQEWKTVDRQVFCLEGTVDEIDGESSGSSSSDSSSSWSSQSSSSPSSSSLSSSSSTSSSSSSRSSSSSSSSLSSSSSSSSSISSSSSSSEVGGPPLENMELWMRGDDIAGADASAILSWLSREGNSYDFAQATGSKQPTKRTSGINSLAASDFDGGDILTGPDNVLSANAGAILFVIRLDVDTDVQGIFSLVSATDYIALYARVNNKLAYSFSGTNVLNGSTTLAVDTNYLVVFRSDGAAVSMRVNGVNETLSVLGGSNQGQWFADIAAAVATAIGGIGISGDIQFLNGRVAEAIAYGTYDTARDALAEQYLATRYGITLP